MKSIAMNSTFIVLAVLMTGCSQRSHNSEDEVSPSLNSSTSEHVNSVSSHNAEIRSGAVSGQYLPNPKDYIRKLDCKDGEFIAKSEEEALWMIAHGYPTDSERKQFASMSLAQLEQRAKSGSKSAEVSYGTKMALERSMAVGLDVLKKSAQAGNFYAYYGLSEVYNSKTGAINDIDSAAYLRLAYLLGDYKAADIVNARGLSPVENAMVDKRASDLYVTFALRRNPSPRPN